MSQLVDMIDYQVKRKGYSPDKFANLLDVCLTTFYERMKIPGNFRLKELQVAVKKTKYYDKYTTRWNSESRR